ncbi:hypothetical protein ACI01nite_24200 [Acetobacter cibinongensis]|uniref:DUF2809 domain-containing protein n=1 Tax=Acetobacter cibinongensis TaxID=146475 RepID=A0A0D6N4Q2_9PROT|nr:DUF2809 domain-containing protein [Acetobacter cibinongensis]GAN60548.1 hypothetical protein Abci_012_021 [Acetobacter cibinongensis]GBQ17793.1 hypothetical protein AA0482_2021 [Acetobacter cibinongensis NRIC 0482]GEL59818.1 hypothetical protein ACI01nite_24200 [Acetobacter cibinongensis]
MTLLSRPPPRLTLLLWLVGCILAGVILRKIPLGLPFFVTKWGGSALWGGMIWCCVAFCIPAKPRWFIAVTACLCAALTEGLKLLHTPALDHVRMTALGGFLLGHHFAWANIGVYTAAILVFSCLLGRL